MGRFFSAFRDNAKVSWGVVALTVLSLFASGALALDAAEVRFERDIHRIGFNQNWGLLDEIKRSAGVVEDSVTRALQSSPEEPPADQPYIVVSIADRRLWYKRGDSVLFTTQVAVGSGKRLEQHGSHQEWKFETPRGRLVIQNKETDPAWIPPDWHFVEVARKKGLGIVQLQRGQTIPSADGSVIAVDGNDVVKKYPDGREVPLEAGEGREITAGGNVVIPPYGTNQRKYAGVLGTHRLNMGDGYALHGTDQPQSIGQAVSHGCVRLHNEDIAYLYSVVQVGTPVFIY